MLYTVGLVLLIIWLLNLANGYAMSTSTHALWLSAIGVCLTGFMLGRRRRRPIM